MSSQKDIEISSKQPEHSEKSRKVQMVNWKSNVLLEKRIQSLNKEEKDVVSFIAIDQRIVTTKFRNKLRRSAKIAVTHQKTLSKLDQRRQQFENNKSEILDKNKEHVSSKGTKRAPKSPKEHINVNRGNTATAKRNDEEMFGFITSMTGRNNTEKSSQNVGVSSSGNNQSKIRTNSKGYQAQAESSRVPFTVHEFCSQGNTADRTQSALQSRAKLWQRRATGATQTVVRVKSAPVSTWRNMGDILNILHSRTGAFYVKNHLQRPITRERFYDTFDLSGFRLYRDEETRLESAKVREFVESLEPLKLIPWTPWDQQKNEKESIKETEQKKQAPFSAFLSRVDSQW